MFVYCRQGIEISGVHEVMMPILSVARIVLHRLATFCGYLDSIPDGWHPESILKRHKLIFDIGFEHNILKKIETQIDMLPTPAPDEVHLNEEKPACLHNHESTSKRYIGCNVSQQLFSTGNMMEKQNCF